MIEYIDRKKVIHIINKICLSKEMFDFRFNYGWKGQLKLILDQIEHLPAEAIVPSAKWEIIYEKDGLKRCRCSRCKTYQCHTPKYCEECGAKMEGEIRYVVF